ncbi:unnamed protein product [Natator depressus]
MNLKLSLTASVKVAAPVEEEMLCPRFPCGEAPGPLFPLSHNLSWTEHITGSPLLFSNWKPPSTISVIPPILAQSLATFPSLTLTPWISCLLCQWTDMERAKNIGTLGTDRATLKTKKALFPEKPGKGRKDCHLEGLRVWKDELAAANMLTYSQLFENLECISMGERISQL